jgi:hypothetical protein
MFFAPLVLFWVPTLARFFMNVTPSKLMILVELYGFTPPFRHQVLLAIPGITGGLMGITSLMRKNGHRLTTGFRHDLSKKYGRTFGELFLFSLV